MHKSIHYMHLLNIYMTRTLICLIWNLEMEDKPNFRDPSVRKVGHIGLVSRCHILHVCPHLIIFYPHFYRKKTGTNPISYNCLGHKKYFKLYGYFNLHQTSRSCQLFCIYQIHQRISNRRPHITNTEPRTVIL